MTFASNRHRSPFSQMPASRTRRTALALPTHVHRPSSPEQRQSNIKNGRPSPVRLVPPSAVLSTMAVAVFIFTLLVFRTENSIGLDAVTWESSGNPGEQHEIPVVKVDPLVDTANARLDQGVISIQPNSDKIFSSIQNDHQQSIGKENDSNHQSSLDTSQASQTKNENVAKEAEHITITNSSSERHSSEQLDSSKPQTHQNNQTLQLLDVGREDGLVKDDDDEANLDTKSTTRYGFERSWPLSKQDDVSNLYHVQKHLAFTNHTLLNYFHMHKTGGVTTKVEVFNFINGPKNTPLLSKRGQRLQANETCYMVEPTQKDAQNREGMWRCDFLRLLALSDQEKRSIDVVQGHQYWQNGCQSIFGAEREVKHFSIFRHPLPRKLSFFYHFYVRNVGRDEKEVQKDEVIAFLLARNLAHDSRARDAGPNYYASRMTSDGIKGFIDHTFVIEKEDQGAVISDVLEKFRKGFAFIGLQIQGPASQCMLRKTFEVFAHEHGIDNMKDSAQFTENHERLNSGKYTWTAGKIWDVMTDEEKEMFRQVEKVDLAIYDGVVERFKKDVEAFHCAEHVVAENWEEDRFE